MTEKRKVLGRVAIAVGFVVGLAWLVWEPLGLERYYQVVEASKENDFIVDQHAFEPGKCRFILPRDGFKSTQQLVSKYEGDVMQHYVPMGTYGDEWVLEDANSGEVVHPNNDSLDDAGIGRGSVLKVVRVEKTNK